MHRTWDESMATGNEMIDRQHREVVNLLDRLAAVQDGPETEVLGVLDQVIAFAVLHFTAEERLMAEVGYPSVLAEQMIDQHREFSGYARLRVLEFRGGEMDCICRLHGFLDDWLKVHEFELDRYLADWIRNRENHRSAE